VPLNFCVTTAAYDLVEEDAGLESILAELIATPADDTARLSELAAAMQAGLLAARLPASITNAIARAHRMLEDGMDVPVAVRSSATAGNLPYASFAGQRDTYLNVLGVDGGTYIRDHWRDHVYGLAISHEVEIHVPCLAPSPARLWPWRSTRGPRKRARAR
jgi:phosphoenolpyruvate synthase/pyruvate phosphate dikinase